MSQVNVKIGGVYIGTVYMSKEEIRKAEASGFTVDYANKKRIGK